VGVTQSSGSVDMSKNTGQIARVDATINGSSTKEWDQRFSYDEVGRLSVASEYQNGTGSTPTWQTKYTYDRWGNRMQSGGTDNFGVGFVSVTGSDIDAATNRFITSGATPTTYDAGGNITQDTKFRNYKYEYDANNRQTAVKLADNTGVQGGVYDCGGQRVQTTANAVTRTMVYDVFGQDVADYSGSSLERENIYRGGQLLATQPFAAARVNVAQSANGATASVTSSLSSSFPAGSLINGDRKGLNWGSGGGWAGSSTGTLSDSVEVDFSGSKTIDEVDVFTIQDSYSSPSEPTSGMTFSSYGLSDYDVQYWNGSAWATVSGGTVTGNNKVWKQISFTALTTTKIKVVAHHAVDSGYGGWVCMAHEDVSQVLGIAQRFSFRATQRPTRYRRWYRLH
jgi:hypothetical protein